MTLKELQFSAPSIPPLQNQTIALIRAEIMLIYLIIFMEKLSIIIGGNGALGREVVLCFN